MKKLLFLILLVPQISLALPISTYQQNILPFLNSTYYLGTTTPSTLSWKGLITDQICLTADTCRTTWPTSGGFAWPFTKQNSSSQATTTLMEWIGGFLADASSTLTRFTASNSTTTGLTVSGDIGGVYLASTGSGVGGIGFNSIPDGSYNAGVTGYGALFQLAPSTGVFTMFTESNVVGGAPHGHIQTINWDSTGLVGTPVGLVTKTLLATGSTTLQNATSSSFAITGLASAIGKFLAVDGAGSVIATTTPTGSVTSVTGTYPVASSGGATPAISLLFGTTTANSWSLLNNFNMSSTTVASFGNAYFGKTATSSFDGVGALTVVASTTLQNFTAITATTTGFLTTNSTTSDKVSFTSGSTGASSWAINDVGGVFTISSTTPSTGATSTIQAFSIRDTGTGFGVGTTTLNNAYMSVVYPLGNGLGNVFSVDTATATPFYVTSNGAVYAPNTTTSGSAQTGYWCYDATGQLIRDTVVCLVSSIRFKENVFNLDSGLAQVLKMRPVSFDYKKVGEPSLDSRGRQVGFIAEEALKVDPRLVEIGTDGLPRAFNYMTYTATLTKAIQEQQAEIEELKARLNKLEKK